MQPFPENFMYNHKQRLPEWLANLLLFGLLIIIVLAAFFWQMDKINDSLQRNAMDRSGTVAAIIEENLQNATLAGRTIDEIVTIFLHDKAKFIEYLDTIEPLHENELTALARQTGLLGISLIRPQNRIISGPAGWLASDIDCSLPDGQLFYRKQQNIGYLVHSTKNSEQDLRCVLVGLNAERILGLQKKTSLPALLDSLSSLPEITFIRLKEDDGIHSDTPDEVTLLQQGNTITALARMHTSLGILEVGLDARYFRERQRGIRNQFILFGSMLLILGIFFSWLLYRYQQHDLQQARHFERMLAREHEAAALGRATATIAHEVRNPLNAIYMGLQRLQLESDNLNQDQEEMLAAMREAVTRTSTIVTELQRFTRDLKPVHKSVYLAKIINQVLTLYKPACSQQAITITQTPQSELPVRGDRKLLAEMVENLIKNAVEAQPAGGFIQVRLSDSGFMQSLLISNGGFSLPAEERNRPGEPYFTSKTRGTGLGLALCRRIAEAHEGQLNIQTATGNDTFTVKVTLPLF